MKPEIEDGPFVTRFDPITEEDLIFLSDKANNLAIEIIGRCNGSVPLAGLLLSGAVLVPVVMGVILTPEKKEEILNNWLAALREDFERVLEDWRGCVMSVQKGNDAERPS